MLETHRVQVTGSIFPLYPVFVKPYLEYCLQLWALKKKKDFEKLEFQGRLP